MALVSYSDSEDDTRISKRSNGKENTKLPPLPQKFHSLYATATRTHPSDDPSLHEGRTRQVPHVDGNWPAHVYLEWYPSTSEAEILRNIVSAANTVGQVHSLLHSPLGAQLPLHISLSAPLVLKTEEKTAFEDAVEEAIKSSRIGEFETSIQGVQWERNFDGTRWFLVLRVSKPFVNDELNRLLACCNGCASTLGLQLLYDAESRPEVQQDIPDKSDAFHLSIAWQLAPPDSNQAKSHPDISNLQMERTLRFDVVKIRIGNVVKDLLLRKP